MGRERELEQLEHLYNEATQQGAQLTILKGASGTGKSRILRAFRVRMKLQGVPVLEGDAAGRDASPHYPYQAFAHIVQDALRTLSEFGTEPSADLHGLRCGDGCHDFWWEHSQTPKSRGHAASETRDAEEKRYQFFDSIRNLLHDVAAIRPPVVLLHNLERADPGTLSLLAELVGEERDSWQWPKDLETAQSQYLGNPAVSFAASACDDAQTSAGLHALEQAPRVTCLDVAELDENGVRAYLQSDDIVRRILERTGGIPEMIDLLVAGAPLSPEDRMRGLRQGLSKNTQALIEALCFLEGPVPFDLISKVADVETAATERQAFAALPELRSEIKEGTLLFSFVRTRDKNAFYASIGKARRSTLHANAARVFASMPGHEVIAARHAIEGHVNTTAELTHRACSTLAATHAYAEAVELLEQAIAFDAQTSLRELAADYYQILGDYQQAKKHARAIFDARPESASAAQRLGELQLLAGEHDAAQASLKNAHELAESARDELIATEVQTRIARLHYRRGDLPSARTIALEALEHAERVGNVPLQIHARSTLAVTHIAEGRSDSALQLFEKNLDDAREQGLSHESGQALINIGVARLQLGNIDDAKRCFSEVLELPGPLETRRIAIAKENLAIVAQLQGHYAVAQEYYYEGLTHLHRLGNRDMLARVANNMADLYLIVGDVKRARALCDFASQMGGPKLAPSIVAEGLLIRGRIELAEEQFEQAEASLGAAHERLAHLQFPVEQAARQLVRLAMAQGKVSAARKLFNGLTTPEAGRNQERLEHVLVDIELRRLEGEPAVRDAQRLVRDCKALGANADPNLLLRCQVALAETLQSSEQPAECAARLDEAERLFAALTTRVPADSAGSWHATALRKRIDALRSYLESAAPSGQPPRISTLPPMPAQQRVREWSTRFPDLVGQSDELGRVLRTIDKVAPTEATVLIRGESGTGKELVAGAIHRFSDRADGPLVKVNCAALVETLLLSELFGHERGAFTGAQQRKKGRFEMADKGTLFLDEIGDISPKTQVALLRVLQEREFERVGGTHSISVDVRIIAATHRNLEKMVQQGAFREDLYYRLRGIMLEVPPLRERTEDLPHLCEHLLIRIARERGEPPKRIADDTLQMLSEHTWPGNIRELDNILRSATLFSENTTLSPDDFQPFASTFRISAPALVGGSDDVSGLQEADTGQQGGFYHKVREGQMSLTEAKRELEKACISQALGETGGNITKAAALLGMKRPRVSQLAKQYGLSGTPSEDELS